MRLLVGIPAVFSLLAFSVRAEDERTRTAFVREGSIQRHVENEAFGDEFFVPDEDSIATSAGPASPELITQGRAR